MAISRPALLALLGAVLLAATFLSVQSTRNRGSEEAAPAAQQAPPSEPAQPAADPVETLRSALSGELRSTAFDLELRLSAPGETARVGLSGAFERGAADQVPALDLHANVAAQGRSFTGGFLAVNEKAYFTQGSRAWQVPEQAWDRVVQAVASGGPAQAQQQPLLDVHPEAWVRDAKTVGEEELDGVQTTHVRASLDVAAMARDLVRAAGADVARIPPPEQLAQVVKQADFDAWVGSDGILRRLSMQLVFDVPKRLSADDPAGRTGIDLTLELSGVNKPQEIEAPRDARDGMPPGMFGRSARGFTAALTGLGGEPPSLAALSTKNPQRAARAVKAGKKVVILFRNPRGLDDAEVARAVQAVKRRSRAVVLTDHVDAVERYGKLVEHLGVSQTPSIVLIDSVGEARLLEGYIDPNSLTQAVADAR